MTTIPKWTGTITEPQARKAVNKKLYALSTGQNQKYYNHIPFGDIAEILSEHGFIDVLFSVDDSRDGRVLEHIGQNTWLTVQWHKMPSGKFEVIAYVS